ncbi:PNK3P-domain-containing protein [Phanerochaete sordida]|uniref:PNK3P-domain-containing protein n=1 Tax=Phanerochaete sordida TaxID=48140 RepID=A0A9P3GL78_9APHY|nr:PNK3P-domain-containing protein [Phanerochaete sordida]
MSSSALSPKATPNPRKRTAEHLDAPEVTKPAKEPKLASIFTKGKTTESPKAPTFQWLEPLGRAKTCLHGANLSPKAVYKVAAFDLDGCLIESSIGKKKVKDAPPTFQWWRAIIPKKLKEIHDEGYAIVVVTNQALRGATAIQEWKKKVPLIGAALPEVPFHLFAATARDGYRKPMPGMWYELERIFAAEDVVIDKSASFFVGDAAGRQGDFAGTDRKWAQNVDIPFFTPEEYFLKLKAAPYTLQGFHPSSLPADLPRVTPTSSPIVPSSSSGPEVVLFVGFPALGKTSFYRTHFYTANYVHVNQDTLRTREKCVKAVEEAIKDGKSCVVDNTNRDAATRKHYIDLAKKLDVPIRCFLFHGTLELAWHNNLYRAFNLPDSVASKAPKRDLVPYNAFTSFKASYEEPKAAEGFREVRRVNWVFEGTEEERRRWNMWLQIDGK